MSIKGIKEALSKGPVSSQVGKRTITLAKLSGSYHITISEPGRKPMVWQYQREKIAIERFEKNVSLLRRSL